METPYSNITEVQEALTPEAANDLLKEGFILVKVMEKYTSDTERQFSNIVYVLGRRRYIGKSRPAPEQDDTPSKPTAPIVEPALLEKRPWKKYSNGGGEWAFYVGRDGSLLPELADAKEFIERLKAGEEFTVGDYTYRIKDKFLKRFPTGGT